MVPAPAISRLHEHSAHLGRSEAGVSRHGSPAVAEGDGGALGDVVVAGVVQFAQFWRVRRLAVELYHRVVLGIADVPVAARARRRFSVVALTGRQAMSPLDVMTPSAFEWGLNPSRISSSTSANRPRQRNRARPAAALASRAAWSTAAGTRPVMSPTTRSGSWPGR